MNSESEALFFVLGAFDQAAFASALTDMSVRVTRSYAGKPFILLDCHDQSIRASGRILLETEGALHLLQKDGARRIQKGKGRGRFVQDLPTGPVREALSGFPKLRALMEIATGERQESDVALLDDLQKTQVRGSVVSLSTEHGRATILRLRRLRGYDKAFDKACAAVRAMVGASPDIESLADAVSATDARYRAKPEIALGTDEPSIQVAADIIKTYLKVAQQNESGLIADIDTEFLHDYRVSLRRIRSVISLFKGVFSEAQTAEFKKTFSELMAPTGRMRDLDVYLLEKDMYFNLVPSTLHAGLDAMFAQFQKERAQELSRITRRLRSKTYQSQMSDLRALFDGTDNVKPGPNAQRGAYDYACALIWKRYRKVCKIARSITPETPDESVHGLRIDCKKLRYLMEFFAPLFDAKDFKSILKPLKKLQDNLGLFNDFSVQQEALLAFTSQQSNAQGRVDAQVGLAVGGLIAVLDQRQRAERDRVIANFQQFDAPETRHLFRSLFHQPKE